MVRARKEMPTRKGGKGSNSQSPAYNRANAYIRPGRKERRWKTISIWRSRKFQQNVLLATSISLLLAYFSLVFPRLHHRGIPLPSLPPPPTPVRTTLAHSHTVLSIPFSSTYCANNSNVVTTAILERHPGKDKRVGGPGSRKAERTTRGRARARVVGAREN